MPVGQLLTWDLTLLNQSLLTPASYKDMETPFLLKDGKDSHYGLGVELLTRNGRHIIEHSGEVGGFVAENILFPDDHAAIAVLTNQEASEAASAIAELITPLLLPSEPAGPTPDAFTPLLRTILAGLQKGLIDRSLFTPDCNAYFSQQALDDYQSSLSPLGSIASVTPGRSSLRGGMTFGVYHVVFSSGTTVVVTAYVKPDGKIEQLLVVGKD